VGNKLTNKINFGSVAKDYAQSRNILPLDLFEQLIAKGFNIRNSRIVDLGCGTGIICRALTNGGAVVIGVDPSNELIQEAKTLDEQNNLSIKYVQATAENTNLPSHSFDAVTVVRAWHWFDRSKALEEIKRILKDTGYLIVMDTAFVPSKSEVASNTIEIFKKYTPDGVLKSAGSKADVKERRDGLPANWFNEWVQAGFSLINSWQIEYEVSFSHEGWHSFVRSLSWFSELDIEKRNQLDKDLHNYLMNYSIDPILMPHVCSVVILKLNVSLFT
jgi:ubiquinone/menaquinone biosynthesis C-methylase UbiE